MSKTIDERVLEMRFDNSHFEKNVATSMSTLDKLKAKLNFKGAGDSLSSLDKATKNVNLNGLSSACDTVHAKFSALEVMGVTALANITNSAVNAGKRMVSALTIDPIKTGLSEYETQINSVQTILANTQSKGSTIADVNRALDELNVYADKTIYNFTEMTRNIGTFTAAGVDLDQSVSAIKGIANLAAVSGSSSQQASTAMYQLSQALATGTVRLQDWNSVVNAGMGGELFQNALKRTAENMGTNVDAMIEKYGSFRDSLTQGEWLTTEVLTKTLEQFTMSAEEGSKEWNEFKESLKADGYTEQQAEEILKMANTATEAATKVKTFTQLWDVMKEAAQSGWAQTWEIIFGDLEEAKALFSPIADFFTGENGIITTMSNARNNLLESAFGKGLTGLAKKFDDMLAPAKKAAETVNKTTDSIKKLGGIVDDTILGKFGNGEKRLDSFAEAGINFYEVQNKVNEKLGDSKRYTEEQIEAQDKLLDSQNKTNESQEKSAEAQTKLSDANKKRLKELAKLSDEQLRNKGYTEEQIKAFQELRSTADKLGISTDDLIDNIDKINGRWLLINSFKNIGKGLVSVFKAIGDAWRDAFPPMQADTLFNIIAGFHKFTTYLVPTEDTVKNLTRTLKGLFAILDIIASVTGGVFKFGLQIVKELFHALGVSGAEVLEYTAKIGDSIVAFRDWFEEHNLVTKAIKKIVPAIVDVVKNVAEMIEEFMQLPKVRQAIENVKQAISDMVAVGEDIINGLVQGIEGGISNVISKMLDLGAQIIEAICSVLGIHSPSTEMIEVGKNIIDGLINGLQNGISKIIEIIKTIATTIKDFFGNIDWDKVFALGTSAGMFLIIKKLLGIVDGFASPFEGLGDIFGNVAKVIEKSQKQIKKTIKAFSNVLNSFAFKERAEGIKDIAISIAILAASVAVLSQINAVDLWKAVGVIATLAIVLGVLTWALDKIGDSAVTINREGLKLGGLKTSLIAIGAGLLLLSAAMRIMGGMEWEEVRDGFVGLLATVGIAALVLKAFGNMARLAGDSSKYVGKVGSMMIKLALSMALMVGVVKLVGMLKPEELKQGVLFAIGFSAFLMAYVGCASILGNNLSSINKLGRMMMTMAITMGLMVGVVKLISLLKPDEIKKGIAGMAVFAAFVWALVSIVRKDNVQDDILKIGGLLMAVSGAMLIMTAVVKIIGGLSAEELIKGGIAIAAFTGIIYLLVEMVKSVEKDAPKIAGTLLAMSISIAILAGIAVIMSFISIPALAKGLIAVGMLGAILSLMIHATKGAQDVKGSIIAMAIAIGVMTASIALLSLIKPEKLVAPTVAIGILMGMFALIAKSASTMTGALGPLIVMTVAVGLIAFVIWKLSDIPAQQAIGTASAIGILMLSMAATLAIVNGIRGVSIGALISLGVMTLIVGALAQILIKMEELNPESALGHVKALSTLILALSGACVILGVVGLMGPAAFVGIGALAALIAGIGGLIIAIGALVTEVPKLQEFLNNGIPVIEQIGHAIGSFFGNIVSGFAEGVTSGLPQIGTDLSTFMTNLEPFVAGAKNIDETAMTGIQNIVKMLGLIAGASIIDSISTFLNFGTSPMESFAQQMNLFGDAIVAFSNKVKGNIDEESVMAAANAGRLLAEMQSMVSGTGGVLQFFTGEQNLETFGTQLVAFGDAIVAFSNKVKGNINEEAVMAAANAGTLMAEMQSKIVPSGGVIQWFTGEKDMAVFAQQLSAFGDAICKFSTSVAGGINEEAVTAAANAGTLMSEMQAKIVPTGGVIQWFTGEKDMATFGTQLVAFGQAIVGFSKTVSAEGAINETAITAAANAGALMTELQSKVEPSGGVIDFFTGRDDLATFGTQLVAFGSAMVDFSQTVSEGMDEGAVTAAANAGKVMATLQKSIPEDKWLDGKMSLDDFGKKIKKFGGYLADYADKVSEVDTGTVSQSITSANRLVALAKNLVDVDPEGIKNFKIKSIGTSLKTYSDNVASIDAGSISNSISAANRLVKLINSMASIDTSGVSSFTSAMGTLGKANISGFVNAFNESAGKLSSVGGNLIDSIAKGARSKTSALSNVATTAVSTMYKTIVSNASQFRTGGAMLMMMLISGINSKKAGVTSAVRTTVSGASTALRGYYTSFYNAGSYLVHGFANGISANTYIATAKARAMAQAAKQAAEEALGIASPSKVFYKIGDFVVQGFTKALGDGSRSAYNAASDMADTARKGFSNAIGKVSDFLNGEMDIQPTIRPVLDLSDVRSGASAINGMLGMQPSVGVMSNLGAISSMMNSRNQNGVNDDVVDAINKLSKRLGNVGNTSYTINGITYDDGSALQDAFSTIVRAAKMGRRV